MFAKLSFPRLFVLVSWSNATLSYTILLLIEKRRELWTNKLYYRIRKTFYDEENMEFANSNIRGHPLHDHIS